MLKKLAGLFGQKRPASSDKIEQFFVTAIPDMLLLQLILKYENTSDAWSQIMVNKAAAGYIFGFHDAMLQRCGLADSDHQERGIELMKKSYQAMFGDEPGVALLMMTMNLQDDPDLMEGRMSGGTELINFMDNKVNPLGLSRILFDMDE